MSSNWPLALAAGAGFVLLLELFVLAVPNLRRSARLGVLFHLCALTGSVVAAVVVGPWGFVGNAFSSAMLVAFAASGGAVVFALFDSLVLERPWDRARGPMTPKLVRDVLRVGFISALMLSAAVAVEVPVPAVVASSTVLSAVIGLALQDVLKNVFAGMALDLEKPFKRGDWLDLGGTMAEVVDLTWRSTHLRTKEGVDLFEPNATISTQRVLNYGTGSRPIGVIFEVGLPYDAPPAEVRAQLSRAVREAPGVASQPESQVFFDRYGDSAVIYKIRAWTHQVEEISRFRDNVNSRVWYRLNRAGIEIPFPIRTVQLHAMEDRDRRLRDGSEERSASLLSRVELFQGVDQEVVRELARRARRQHYDRGEVMMKEGDSGDTLFVLESGRVLVSRSGATIGTGTIELATLGPGQFFGEMSLLTGSPRSATVTADESCQVLVVPHSALRPVLVARPELAEHLSQVLADRQQRAAERFADRRDRSRGEQAADDPASLLTRIRGFFRLG